MLRGFVKTRLRSAAIIGDVVLLVESALDFPASGVVLLEDEESPLAYTGRDLTVGAQRLTGVDPLTAAHPAHAEVVDWTRNTSQLDLLRRATLVDYAEGKDLDRIGRNHGLWRLRGLSDGIYREVIKAIAYTYRGTIYAIEMLLDALYPAGGWDIYESRIEHPAEIFITIPGEIGTDPLGRTFMNAQDDVTSGGAAAVTVTDTPTTVESVKQLPVTQLLEMGILPSAEATPWAYQAESAGAEGAYFSIVGDELQHVHPAGTDSGRYERQVAELGTEFNWIEIAWQLSASVAIGGYPWKIYVQDGEYEYALIWNGTHVALAQADETLVSAAVAVSGLTAGYHTFKVLRDGDTVRGYVDGINVVSEPAASFGASGNKYFCWGYTDNGNANDWTCLWDECLVYTKYNKNYWNLSRTDGQLTLGSDDLLSAANLFLGGDVGNLVWLPATNDENYGLWDIIVFVGIGQVTLDGHLWRSAGYADSLTPDRYYTYEDRFVSQDAAKSLVIPTSAEGNDDTYPILAVISKREVQLDVSGHPGGLVTESNLGFKFAPDFVNEVGIEWQLIDAGSFAGVNLTLREALPAANVDVRVEYTTALSAVLLRDETVVRGDSYPFYIQGIDERLQELISSITAAGVIPRYFKEY